MKKTNFLKNMMVVVVLITILSVLAIPVVASQYIFTEMIMDECDGTLTCTYIENGTYTSVNQMQMMVERGQAPAGVVSVHNAHGAYGKPHVHFTTGALNIDGSVHDGTSPNLTSSQRSWLSVNGWGGF